MQVLCVSLFLVFTVTIALLERYSKLFSPIKETKYEHTVENLLCIFFFNLEVADEQLMFHQIHLPFR